MPGQIAAIGEEPVQTLLESRQSADQLVGQDLHREQRDQPDHRANAQRDAATVDVHLVVVEAVLLVPQPRAADGIHGVGDVDEVLEELGRDVLRSRIEPRQLQGHGEHRGAVERHPGGAVRLLQEAAVGKRPGAVENADVVQPQEAAREQVLAAGVLAIDPPGEIDQQLLEGAGEKTPVALAPRRGHLVDPPAGPGMDRRIDVAQVELVGRDLPVGVHVPLAQQERELVLGEHGVQPGEGDHVKRQVPRRIPRVLPLVGNRENVPVEQMVPIRIAPGLARLGRRREVGIAL